MAESTMTKLGKLFAASEVMIGANPPLPSQELQAPGLVQWQTPQVTSPAAQTPDP